jgi:hypothetical protein
MENEQTTSQMLTDALSERPKTCKLAVISIVLGILGPFSFAVAWVLSFLPSHDLITASRYITAAFSYSLAWILGLMLGLHAVERIRHSEQQLAGEAYAIAGIAASAAWMVVVLVRLLLPALYYVNS